MSKKDPTTPENSDSQFTVNEEIALIDFFLYHLNERKNSKKNPDSNEDNNIEKEQP